MRIVSAKLTVVLVMTFLGAAAGAGCNSTKKVEPSGNEPLAVPPGKVSVFQLAGLLGLKVDLSSRTDATLRDVANSVTIFPDPGGQVYVNGRAVGPRGGIVPVGDTLFVPQDLEEEIRRNLRKPPDVPRPKPPRPTLPSSRVEGLVVIDPGHGGKDPGALSILRRGGARLQEKDVNLAVGSIVADSLRRRGVTVKMTRQDDEFIELEERAAIANRADADLFVSIHADSSRNSSAEGFTVYVARSASGASLTLAKAVESNLSASGVPARALGRADYRVLVQTSCPAVLVELGFLSNGSESAKLADDGYRRRLGEAVADGIVDWLKAR